MDDLNEIKSYLDAMKYQNHCKIKDNGFKAKKYSMDPQKQQQVNSQIQEMPNNYWA